MCRGLGVFSSLTVSIDNKSLNVESAPRKGGRYDMTVKWEPLGLILKLTLIIPISTE
jgi:hypothetical protein